MDMDMDCHRAKLASEFPQQSNQVFRPTAEAIDQKLAAMLTRTKYIWDDNAQCH